MLPKLTPGSSENRRCAVLYDVAPVRIGEALSEEFGTKDRSRALR